MAEWSKASVYDAQRCRYESWRCQNFFFCKIFFEAGIKEAGPRRAMEGSSNFLLWDVRSICGCNLKLADCCRTQVKKGYKGLSENLLLHKKNLGLKKKFLS